MLSAPDNLAGFRWLPNGQSVLSGELLDYFHRLDALFVSWASVYQAVPYAFAPLIPAQELARLDYFRNFPHLATFATVLDTAPENMDAFTTAVTGCDCAHGIPLTQTAPVTDVLTPAACYPLYMHLQGTVLPAASVATTRGVCYRRETHYQPLQRQWSFSMREIILLGTAEEVQERLDALRERVTTFLQSIGLPVRWEVATDPFFNPSTNPKYLMQRLDPVKHEMVFGEGLAIGSVNAHRNYFGEVFDIQRNNAPAFSGCVAFGLERWLYAFYATYGPEVSQWPRLL
jgi:seryl-tRNA synthetase